MVDLILQKEERKMHPLYSKAENKNTRWRCFTFHDNNIAEIERIFRGRDVGCAFKTKATLLNILEKKVTHKDQLEKSGVYRINCDECELFYLGESGRCIRVRMNKHRKYQHRSTFGRHLLNTGHTSKDNNNVKILHKQSKGFKLNLLEGHEIWKERDNKNLLNEQVILGKDLLFKVCY